MHRPTNGLPELTAKERLVLRCVWDGQETKAIAKRLGNSPKTIEAHRSSIMKKWRVSNTAQLLRMALRYGVLR